ncbi:MAG: DUF885 domain-containing protein [Gammaproteobacteria bacterium AqS3]|nr:DUF885 domain-containing protein [Gammaproteobacteria bacterium AqS3]
MHYRLFTVVLMAFLLGGCEYLNQLANESAEEFFAKAYEEQLMTSPETLTALGRRERYGEWDSYAERDMDMSYRMAQRQLEELRGLSYDQLTPENRLNYDLFERMLERQIERNRWRLHTYPVNQMFGVQAGIPALLINFHRIDSEEDALAYIERIRGVEKLLKQVNVLLQKQQKEGIFPPKFVYPLVIGTSERVLSGKPLNKKDDFDNAVYADFVKKVKALNLDQAKTDKLIERASNALLLQFSAGYRQLIGVLRDLESKATEDDGVWKLPDGEEYYNFQLRSYTTTDMTADEIHQKGLEDVKRVHAEMDELRKQVNFRGDLQAFFKFMRSDKQFYYPETDAGRQAYLDDTQKIIDAMEAKLGEQFITIPTSKLKVKRVEKFREKAAGKAFYSRPAPDGSRPGIYYANLSVMADMPKYQMEALAYHEGVPGHHLQLAVAAELEGVPEFRKLSNFTAYIEGWGLYSEYLPKEVGMYQDPYSDFGRLAMELWRSARLVVDTGLHSKKWTRQQAIDWLIENTPNPENDSAKSIERYIVMPGQATAYKIGMMKILELREGAREQLGENFDIRKFHEVVLQNGAVPLDILESLIDEWVANGGN